MFKKNSIFTRVLIPVVIVALLQNLLVSAVLFINGSIASVEDGAVDSLKKNAGNRAVTLETTMVHDWANIDKLENDIIAEIEAYLNDGGLTIDEALGSYEHEIKMLGEISGLMLSSFRRNTATGVFMYFIPEGAENTTGIVCNGLYYRDLDPVSTPADNSDILFLMGFIDIARKDKIQLDSMWSEVFTFEPDISEVWKSYKRPADAARENPDLSAADLSYWSRPHLINPRSPIDSDECMTYTRPILYEGRLIAMVGSEIHDEQLRKYFPASDFDSTGMGGYMLIKYDRTDAGDTIGCEVYTVTGSYIKRIVESGDTVTLTKTRREGVYTIENADEAVHVAPQPLRLYNDRTPFSEEQWALASIGTDNMLFATSRRVTSGILYSSAFSLIIGIALIAIIIRLSTKPLLKLAEQIENSDPDETIVTVKSDTYETALLCTTINALRDRRRHMESELREERERYLIALESAGDTFMEYDITQDLLMLYHFSAINRKPELVSKEVTSFREKIMNGEICCRDDIHNMLMFFDARTTEPIEARVSAELFSHFTEVTPENGYYWVLINASYIYNDEGVTTRVIGTARQIMDEKRREQERIEYARRDQTTGLYNRDYGIQLVKNQIYAAFAREAAFAVCALRVDGFKMLEAHYGRVFGGVVIKRFSDQIRLVMRDNDTAVRIGNDEFIIFFSNAGKVEVRNRIYQMFVTLAEMYTGENNELDLSLSVGAALSGDAFGANEILNNAYAAGQYAIKTGGGHLEYYDELPPDIAEEIIPFRENPISVSLDISQENIVGLAFDLFERTSDMHSVINILLALIGKLYNLDQIVICAYDAAFDTDQMAYQWSTKDNLPLNAGIEKVLDSDLKALEGLMDENGVQVFGSGSLSALSAGVRKLLCIELDEKVSMLCAVLYEKDVQTGRMLFKSRDEFKTWTGEEMSGLYEIAKIISARISIEKSNSASRAKSEFLSRISHEIRTPMNAIIGMTGIAMESRGSPERVDDCLEKIDFSARHLLSLINDVLDMSRIESGRLELEYAVFSLNELAAAVDTLMRPQLESRGITFSINLDCVHDHMIGDEYRLRQVLVNLLGNAGKFTQSGGTIMLNVEELSTGSGKFGYFRFSVSDNGIGISGEDQKRIFEAFTQATAGTTPAVQSRGTGLGLTISSSIVGAMGGRIELESEIGEGSEFYFTLKLEFAGEKTHETDDGGDKPDYEKRFLGKRVLLAEDNDINLEIAAYILEKVGLELDFAKNGLEALESFMSSEQGEYAAILMDIQMPVMDGLTATREIRKINNRPDAKTIPIIAMTANAFDEDMKKSIESGMNGHVAKPIDNELLYTLLDQLIGG